MVVMDTRGSIGTYVHSGCNGYNGCNEHLVVVLNG